jgi:hypothetical protein
MTREKGGGRRASISNFFTRRTRNTSVATFFTGSIRKGTRRRTSSLFRSRTPSEAQKHTAITNAAISHAAVVKEKELKEQRQEREEKANYAIDGVQLADLMERRKEENKVKIAEQQKEWLKNTTAQAASAANANRIRVKHQKVYATTGPTPDSILEKYAGKKKNYVSKKEAEQAARQAADDRLKEQEEEQLRLQEEEQHAVLESSEERAAREHHEMLQAQRDVEQAVKAAAQADADRVRALAAKIGLKKDIEIMEGRNNGDEDEDEEWMHGLDANGRKRKQKDTSRDDKYNRDKAARDAGLTYSNKVDRYSRKYLERTGVAYKKMVTTHSPERKFWNKHHEEYQPYPEGWLGPEGWLAGGIHPLRTLPEFSAQEEVEYKERVREAKAREARRERRRKKEARKLRKQEALDRLAAASPATDRSVDRAMMWWPPPEEVGSSRGEGSSRGGSSSSRGGASPA